MDRWQHIFCAQKITRHLSVNYGVVRARIPGTLHRDKQPDQLVATKELLRQGGRDGRPAGRA